MKLFGMSCKIENGMVAVQITSENSSLFTYRHEKSFVQENMQIQGLLGNSMETELYELVG